MSGMVRARNANFACRFINGDTNGRNAKLGQRELGRGHVTYF